MKKIKFIKNLDMYKKGDIIEITEDKYSDILKKNTKEISGKNNKAILFNKNTK